MTAEKTTLTEKYIKYRGYGRSHLHALMLARWWTMWERIVGHPL